MIIYEEILRDFQKEKVRFVLVGRIALNLFDIQELRLIKRLRRAK